MFELHLVSGSVARRLAPIGSAPLLVGRSLTNDVVLEDERISGRHLRLWSEEGQVHVRDLGSRNGTRINGAPLSGELPVRPGDEIELGQALVLQIVERDASRASGPILEPAVREAIEALRLHRPDRAALAEATLVSGAALSEGWSQAIRLLPSLVAAGRRSAVLQLVADEARRISLAPTVAALVWTGPPGARAISGSAHTGDATRLFPVEAVSTSVVERVLADGVALWSDDAIQDRRLSDHASVQSLALHSVGCCPLGPSAVLYLSDPTAGGRFGPPIRARIEALCAVASPFVDRSWLPSPAEALPGMVGESQRMGEVFDSVRAFAPMPWPMLILGETGTGKERVAAAIHQISGRSGPLVAVNCGALSDDLALSQLFGHEVGAFTGAERRHVGYLERAGSGTLFLDEVGELSPLVQARLLRVLQEGRFERLGGEELIPFGARVVAATHRPLDEASQRAPFRDDLYHRLAACVIRVPPLRDRPEDIGPLASHLLQRLLGELPSGARIRLSAAASRALQSRSWPGNVRELENALRIGVARCLARRQTELRPEHLDNDRAETAETADDLHTATLAFQSRRVKEMLEACGDNRAEAARRLGVSRQFLYRLFAREVGS